MWKRDSALIQDDHSVLHVPVHNMHLKVGAIGGPPWATLDRTVNFNSSRSMTIKI